MPDLEDWTFQLNGRSFTVRARESTPLLYVLRNDAGLRGARFGCGSGACGACTVLIDRRAQTSCDLPVASVSGRSVETIEGVTGPDKHHPIVAALIAEQAGQCGYCLPGIVMRLKALFDDVPHPTRDQIAQSLDGNLCRCGAHQRILRAAMKVAGGTAEVR